MCLNAYNTYHNLKLRLYFLKESLRACAQSYHKFKSHCLTKFRFRGISNSYKKTTLCFQREVPSGAPQVPLPSPPPCRGGTINPANQFKSYICLFSTCGLQMIISFVVVSTSGKAIFNFLDKPLFNKFFISNIFFLNPVKLNAGFLTLI